jgi:hypothetical protein
MNLIALQKISWLIQGVWRKSDREIIESMGIDYGDHKDTLEVLKSLNAKKDDPSLIRIVNTLLKDTDLRRLYDSGWNIDFIVVKDVVDDMLKLLEDDGYEVDSFHIKYSGALHPPIYSDILEGSFINDRFYSEVIGQINRCYHNKLFPPVTILIRKLLENLIIDILRSKYGTKRLILYYAPDRSRFHDFAVLAKNLKENVADFQPYTSALNDRFFTMLENFRDQGNSSAHSLEVFITREDIDTKKEAVNYLVSFLFELMQKVKADVSMI